MHRQAAPKQHRTLTFLPSAPPRAPTCTAYRPAPPPTQPVAVGSTNKIAGGGCMPECPWDHGIAVDDIAFAIEKDQLADWMEDVRRITKMDLQDNGAAPERCAAL